MSSSDDDGVLDMVREERKAKHATNNSVRLKNGINIGDLSGNGGVVFETEVDMDALQKNDQEYFSGVAGDDLVNRMESLHTGNDDEIEDEEFQEMAKKMTDLTTDGGVLKRITKGGIETEGPPPDRSYVTVHYNLWLEGQDEPFDSTILRGRVERHKLDEGRLIPGLEIAIKSMKMKEKATFLISPNYAFGRLGCPPRVPGECDLKAEVELVAFAEENEAEAVIEKLYDEEQKKLLDFPEIKRVATRERREGNDFFNVKEYKKAREKYSRAIELLEKVGLKDDKEEAEQKADLLKCYLNRGECCIRTNNPKRACLDLQKCLELEPRSSKANFRLSRAKSMLGNTDDALRYAKRAQRLSPTDTDIKREITAIYERIEKYKNEERTMMARMFPGLQNQSNPMENVDDDFYEDVSEQFKAYAESGSVEDFVQPPDWTQSELEVAKMIAKNLNLKLKQVRKVGMRTQWAVSRN